MGDLLCRLGLHRWRFTDWTESDGDVDCCGDACARPDCRRVRGTNDRLRVERRLDASVRVPPDFMGAFFVPSSSRLVRVAARAVSTTEETG